jgi:hypothetical protein
MDEERMEKEKGFRADGRENVREWIIDYETEGEQERAWSHGELRCMRKDGKKRMDGREDEGRRRVCGMEGREDK